jgi:hypothetical protein
MPDAGTPLDPFLRSGRAAAPRTLVDVLEATTAAHPEASALEDERGGRAGEASASRVSQGRWEPRSAR